jgi:two-component sensor histidine kinase
MNALTVPTALLFLLVGNILNAQTERRLDSIRTLPDDTTKVDLFLDAAIDRFNEGGGDDAALIREGIALARAANDRKRESIFYGVQGTHYFNVLNYDSAQIAYREGMRIAEELDIPLLSWRHRFDLAYAQQYAGAYEESNLTSLELLRLAEEMDNPQNIAKAANLLAQNAAARGAIQEALVYDDRAIAAARRSDVATTLSVVLTHKAGNLHSLGRSREGLALTREALEVLPPGRIYEEYQTRQMNTQLLTALGDYDAALAEIERVREIEGEDVDPTSLMALADLQHRIGEHSAARANLHEAVALLKHMDNPRLLAETYLRLSLYEPGARQLDTAEHYHRLMYVYQDTVQQRANQATSLELEEQYATAEREAEIAEQQARLDRQRYQLFGIGSLAFLALVGGGVFYNLSRKLRHRNAENERLVGEKETLIGEIHHRVKNNLQVVSSLLQLQRRGLADEGAADALRESQGRVQAMGLIHQKLYQHEDVTSVFMPDYIEDLSATLLDAYRLDERVDLYCDVEDIQLDVDTAIPLGLIINELVTNSLKYAFPDGREGTVEIALHRAEGREGYILTVADNGVGTDTTTTDPQGTGFGSNLTDLLSKRLGGRVERSVDDGYRTRLHFGSTVTAPPAGVE